MPLYTYTYICCINRPIVCISVIYLRYVTYNTKKGYIRWPKLIFQHSFSQDIEATRRRCPARSLCCHQGICASTNNATVTNVSDKQAPIYIDQKLTRAQQLRMHISMDRCFVAYLTEYRLAAMLSAALSRTQFFPPFVVFSNTPLPPAAQASSCSAVQFIGIQFGKRAIQSHRSWNTGLLAQAKDWELHCNFICLLYIKQWITCER